MVPLPPARLTGSSKKEANIQTGFAAEVDGLEIAEVGVILLTIDLGSDKAGDRIKAFRRRELWGQSSLVCFS
jgi:hypothetical protein